MPEEQTFNYALGDFLCHARTRSKLTQAELARRIGVSPQQIQKYESGKNRISVYRMWQILHATNMSIAEFFENK